MTETVERTFDWRGRFDERSRLFGIMEATVEPPLHNRAWTPPPVPLNQGSEGACVGHGWVHEALATPIVVDVAQMAIRPVSTAQQLAFFVYKEAQKIDPWDGENYVGTSVLAGAKIMMQLGTLKEYRWAFDVAGIRRAILTTGPVVIGIPWLSGMYSAPGGYLTVSGSHVGGHCVIVTAYRVTGSVFKAEAAYGIFNSWGPSWGKNGFAWIRESALAGLMAQDGEACIPFRRSYAR